MESANSTMNNSKDTYIYGRSAEEKRRRSDAMLLLFRALTFSFSLAAVAVMATNKYRFNSQLKVSWYDFDPFRYVLAVNAIICIYSFVETWLAVYTYVQGSYLLPEIFQVWFDYGHDQGFAYLLFSANSAGVVLAQLLQSGNTLIHGEYRCTDAGGYCTQARISIAFGFVAFLFLALSSLLTGLRVAKWYLQ